MTDSTTSDISSDSTVNAADRDEFLQRLGRRVKVARRARKLSRRQVAEISSVSQRFLSQFESGEGNISIMRFHSICAALELPMEALLEEEPGASGISEITRGLNTASPAQVAMVREVLNLQASAATPTSRIALIGLRGAGKSTLAPILARELGYRVIELNHEIRKEAGVGLDEVFSLYGQAGYRRLERDALERIADREDNIVITTGGGIVSDITTYRYLLSQFLTVWISTSPEEHMRRVTAQGDKRPIENSDAPMQALNTILAERKPLYSMAPLAIDTAHHDAAASGRALIEAIRQHL